MFARVHTLETTPEQYEHGLELVREQLLPWARESSGFCGLIAFARDDREESLVVTLWKDEESLERSAEAGDKLSGLAASATGANRRSLHSSEVTLYDVPAEPREPAPGAVAGQRR